MIESETSSLQWLTQEIELRWQRFTLEWKEKRVDKLEKTLRKKELNLQFVDNNFKESCRRISSTADSSTPDNQLANDLWEAPPLTEDAGTTRLLLYIIDLIFLRNSN